MRHGRPALTARNSVRGPALRLGLGVLIAIGLGYSAYYWLKMEDTSKILAQSQLADAQQRVATALEDRHDLAAYKSAYEGLIQNHILGSEERLPWIEHYTHLTAIGNPVTLELTLEPQRVFESPPKQTLGDMQFYASRLNLQAELIHDGDFYKLLAGLRSVTGAHIVRACSVARKSGESGSEANPANLDLKCEVDLMTINKTAPPAAAS